MGEHCATCTCVAGGEVTTIRFDSPGTPLDCGPDCRQIHVYGNASFVVHPVTAIMHGTDCRHASTAGRWP